MIKFITTVVSWCLGYLGLSFFVFWSGVWLGFLWKCYLLGVDLAYYMVQELLSLLGA